MITWQPGLSLEEVEKHCILQALRFFNNNKSQTAIALGITVKTIDNKLERYENDRARLEAGERARDIKNTEYLRRARGVGFQIPNEGQAGLPSAGTGVHVEPTLQNSPQQPVSVPKREEVQSVLPKHSTQSGSGKRR